MTEFLKTIMEELLCPDSKRIKEATKQLDEAVKKPETLWNLCQVLTSAGPVEIRQMAAVLLDKRLNENDVWQGLTQEHQIGLKQHLMQALVGEKERLVKSAIARVVGTVVRFHDQTQDEWICEVLQYTYARCALLDPNESDGDSFTFAAIAESATTQFADQMTIVCRLFQTVMVNADAQNTLTSRTVANMFTGMVYLIPFLVDYPAGGETVIKLMPLILKSAHLNALKGECRDFVIVFGLFDALAEYIPSAFHSTEIVAKFLMDISVNELVDKSIRLQCITFFADFVRVSKTEVLRQNILQPIVRVLFEMICKQPADDHITESDGNSYAEAASQALDEIAMSVSGDRLLPLLFQLMEPALQSSDNQLRGAAYNCMGTISEGCTEIICKQYLEIMLNVIKTGTEDSDLYVRSAAFFALGQFSENLQPDINKFAPEILTMLLGYLRQLIVEMKTGTLPVTKHVDQLFYALEKCCESLGENIVQHLPLLMDCVFESLSSPHTRSLRFYCLSVLAYISDAGDRLIIPYFGRIVGVMQGYLVKDCDKEIANLRIIAINTWASFVRAMSKEVLTPFCNESMGYCLLMLSDGPDDPEVRYSIYNLLGALSNIFQENMAPYLPKIMDRIVLSVISPCDADWSTDNESGDSNDDDDDDELYGIVENEYMTEKEEAIYVLKEFSITTGIAFAPYLQAVFQNVYKVIDHPIASVRKACVESLCKFLMAFHRLGNSAAVAEYSKILVRKFYQMIINDENRTVVIHVLDEIIELIRDIEAAAIPSQECVKLLFKATRKLLMQTTKCQNCEGLIDNLDGVEGSRLDEQLLDYACNLFADLGYATEPAQFAVYYDKGLCILSKMLKSAIDNNSGVRRTLIYETLADGIKHLSSHVVNYFDALYNVFLNGANDTEVKCREQCYYGLGELLFHGEKKSPAAWPEVLQCISNAMSKETEPAAKDRICSALSRLLVSNPTDIQFEEILSALLDLLPLRKEFVDYGAIIHALQFAYAEPRGRTLNFVDRIFGSTVQILYSQAMPESGSYESAVKLFQQISKETPDILNSLRSANPKVYGFVMSL